MGERLEGGDPRIKDQGPGISLDSNPYLFVVGCPRSGTTLLQRMLDNHPRLAVANDTHFIPRVIDGVPPGVDQPLTPELVERVRTYKRFYRMELPDAAVYDAAKRSRTYTQFVGALYSEHGRLRGKPLAGEKTPDYVRRLPFLHALFPRARTVHIIRDGRDVALSALEWGRKDRGPGRLKLWWEEPVAVCALWWRWQVGTGRRDGRTLGADLYREVRYEDLVAHPGAMLQDLARFLDLPFSRDMLAYHEGKVRYAPGLSAKKAWLPPVQGLRSWRARMPGRDLELFEALAGDLLSELGYELGAGATSPEVVAVSERCREWWDSEMARRKAKESRRMAGSRTG
jgi:hypothetical protein